MADIKSRLQLDGEQEYRQALDSAYRSLRVLRSELKAETAELGRNASAQDKASKKVDSLKKQIEQQKKIVETLKKALEDSKKEYADNQEVQDKWEEKLNKAREALANMENQMASAEDTLHSFADAMKDTADGSDEAVQNVVSFNDCLRSIGDVVGGVSSAISGIFSASVSTMTDMVDQMYSLMAQAWTAAGDWKDIQTIWGGSLEDIERVMTGAKLQGVDVGEITSGIQKLVTNTHSGNKETLAALKALGIEESDYASHWDYFMGVMSELSMRHGNERFNLATALFGDKKGSGMTNVVDNWNELLDKYQTNVEGTGLHLYDDEILALDDLSHKITEIQGLWDTLKTSVGAKLADVLNMDGLGEQTLEILQDVGKIFSGSGDRKELVIELESDLRKLLDTLSGSLENLSGFIKEISTELSTSTNPVLAFLGGALTSLADVIDWVGENSDTIVSWLNTLLPIMMGNKALEAVTGKGVGDWLDSIVQTGLQIAQIKLLGTAFGGAAKSALDAAATGTSMGVAMGAGLLSKLPWLATLGVQAVEDVASAAGGVGSPVGAGVDMLLHGTSLGRALIGEGTWDEVADDFSGWVESVKENASTFTDDWSNLIDTVLGLTENRNELTQEQEGAGTAMHGDKGGGGHHFGEPETAPTPEEREPYQFSYAQILAAQRYWDAMRNDDDTSDEFMELRDAFSDNSEMLTNLLTKISEFYNEDPESEFLPSTIFTTLGNLASALMNLSADKYKGESKPVELKNDITITIPVYVDGDMVSQQVSHKIAGSLMRLFA